MIAKTYRELALATAMLASSAGAQVAGVPMEENACQRECLEGMMDRYLQAMADGEVSDELFARGARFTENGVELPLGNEGLWATATAIGGYRFYVPDTQTRQVAFMGTMMEEGRSRSTGPAVEPEPVGIDVRLKIDDEGRISEIEQIVARPERPLRPTTGDSGNPFPATGNAVEDMGSPHPIFLATVPEDERMSREELIAVANQYFEGMQRNDGNGYYPFTDDCLRYENGILAAAPADQLAELAERPSFGKVQTCKGQFETSLKGIVTGIRDRRFVAVDRERGIVYSFAFFDHRPINWTWQLGELFKIEKNQIRRIEAIFIRGPYGMCSGWSTYEQCRSEEIQDVR